MAPANPSRRLTYLTLTVAFCIVACLIGSPALAGKGLADKQTASFGKAVYDSLADQPESDKHADVVRTVVKRLVARGLPKKHGKTEWQVKLIDDERPDAIALPGGYLVLTSGLLPAAKTEAGLAAVLAHLMAHVVAGHGATRIDQQLLMTGLATADELSLDHEKYGSTIVGCLGAGTLNGVVLPFLRNDEMEADVMALSMMAAAGYDPNAAAAAWDRLVKLFGDTGRLTVLSTHPSSNKRKRAADEALPKAVKTYGKADYQYGLGLRIDR
ncbi:MAG: M48 family metallopeptidase [bacterium]|nr:M48 family metallopeptidase [bacterium]